MKINELLEIVHQAYPNEQTRCCWDPIGRQVCPGSGDTLAEFVVQEIAETYDPKATDKAQLEEAARLMRWACIELEAVIKALEARLRLPAI